MVTDSAVACVGAHSAELSGVTGELAYQAYLISQRAKRSNTTSKGQQGWSTAIAQRCIARHPGCRWRYSDSCVMLAVVAEATAKGEQRMGTNVAAQMAERRGLLVPYHQGWRYLGRLKQRPQVPWRTHQTTP